MPLLLMSAPGLERLESRWNQSMADTVSPEVRSRIMSRIKSRDTSPELKVRSRLHAAGFRFRLHRSDLPGKPDIVLPRYKTAVFVNGCFWHGHDCPDGHQPSSNREYWATKLSRNIERDRANYQALLDLGWKVAAIWECELDEETDRLVDWLRHRRLEMPKAERLRAARLRQHSPGEMGAGSQHDEHYTRTNRDRA